jgi:hypothetical protein
VEPVAKLKSTKAKPNNMKPDMLRLKGFKVKRGIKGYAHMASERLSEAQSMQDFMSQILGMLIENLRRDDSRVAKTENLVERAERVKFRKNRKTLGRVTEMGIRILGPC